MNWFSFTQFLAEAEQKPPQQQDPFFMFMPLIAIAVLFYFMLIRPQQREQSKRQAMLSTLKKNDRVLTIGGMIGTVANISGDGEEVTLKVDDNTRIRVIRSSIQKILSGEEESDKSSGTPTA